MTAHTVVLLLSVGSQSRGGWLHSSCGLLESAAEFQVVLSDTPKLVVLLGVQMFAVCCRFRGCRDGRRFLCQGVPVAEV